MIFKKVRHVEPLWGKYTGDEEPWHIMCHQHATEVSPAARVDPLGHACAFLSFPELDMCMASVGIGDVHSPVCSVPLFPRNMGKPQLRTGVGHAPSPPPAAGALTEFGSKWKFP